MIQLKQIVRAFAQLVQAVWRLPQTVANAFRQRQRQIVLDELEVERLDRIRNPWKYRGK